MKRIIPAILIALALAGCAPTAPDGTPTPPLTAAPAATAAATAATVEATPEASGPLIPSEDYPRVDGSTACLPLMALVRSRTTGEDLTAAEELTDCTTTSWAYYALVGGQADLLLVYEPAETTRLELLDTSDVKLDFTPIGRDALVFITHQSNPVDDLTTGQLIDIYTGKVTNWSEVGGDDTDIVAYQREESSGSQALFLKLLMKDTAPMQAPTELYPGAMSELIEAIAAYSNEGNALGYSVYYYAKNMYTLPGIKFIAVDGVVPSEDAIADASYPFVNDFYVVTRADETDAATLALRAWITGPEGQKAIVDAGYIPAQ